MATLRAFAALLLCVFLCRYPDLLQGATNAPMAFLRMRGTQNSIQLWLILDCRYSKTKLSRRRRKLGMPVGPATLAFSHGAPATLQKVEKGTPMDLASGSLLFTAPENAMVEVHVAGALLRPESATRRTQSEVRMLQPMVQVSPIHGDLKFRTDAGRGNLPDLCGCACRRVAGTCGGRRPALNPKRKTVIYIVARSSRSRPGSLGNPRTDRF